MFGLGGVIAYSRLILSWLKVRHDTAYGSRWQPLYQVQNQAKELFFKSRPVKPEPSLCAHVHQYCDAAIRAGRLNTARKPTEKFGRIEGVHGRKNST